MARNDYNPAGHTRGRDIEQLEDSPGNPPHNLPTCQPDREITAAIYVYVTRKFCGRRIFIVQVRRFRRSLGEKKEKFGSHVNLRTVSLAGKT